MINHAKENFKLLLSDMEKARDILLFSFSKCSKINMTEGLTDNEMESLEALTSRFSRLSDILIQKVFRAIDIFDLDDEGTVRDRINRAEKKGYIDSADVFIDIRILRNEISHEYKTETIYSIYRKVLGLSPALLESVSSVVEYSKKYTS